jgi:hypothetical protein
MIRITISLIFIFLVGNTHAQCKGFAKKECRPMLSPYTPSGQMNSATMYPGGSGEIMLTFYSRQSYRIVVCDDGNLGPIPYKIMDKDKNVIYDSKTDDHKKRHFDFKLASTQQLVLLLTAPDDNGFNSKELTCVSVMVGTKE